MKIERSGALNASPWERTDERKGYANGFKPKRLSTRLGELKLNIPQVREKPVFIHQLLNKANAVNEP